MELSIIIINYNVKHFLKQCLYSVANALEGIDGEVIVVDNNSFDQSYEYIKSEFPNVEWIQNESNVGFGRANNQALKECSGKYTLLLNPDTILKSDTLRKCIDFLNDNEEAGALGIKMIDGSGRFLPESKRSFPTPEVAFYKLFGLAKLFPNNERFGQYHLTYLDNNKNHEVEVLSGAFMVVRTSLINEIGGFDEDFFMYGEDIDLSYKIKEAGYKNYYFAESTILHYKGESTKRGSVNYVIHFYQAMVIFAKKHYEKRKKRLFIFIMNLAIAFRGFLALFGNFIRSIGLFLLDFALAFVIIYGLKEAWLDFKPEIEEYLPNIYYINFPLYILLGLFCMFFSGAYDRPYKLSKIIRGAIYSIILIAIVYAFLPVENRFSRAMVVFSSIGIAMALTMNRMFAQYIRHGSFSFYRSRKKNFMIVGDTRSLGIKDKLLEESHFNSFLGLVTNQNVSHEEKVGGVHQLGEMIKQIQPSDIIVDTETISYTKFISLLEKYGKKNVRFHTVIDDGKTIISSHDSHLSGEIYNANRRFQLGLPSEKRKKRLFDIVSSLAILFLSPLLIWLQESKTQFFKDCFSVLFGKRTWVGYSNGMTEDLPKIKQGVLTTHGIRKKTFHAPAIEKQLNYRYAKSYSIYEDLDILLQNINRL